MWGFDSGWGFGMLLWMTFVWAVVLATTWIILKLMGGPRLPHGRH